MNRSLLNQRYVPLRKIAAGGMGEIYLARQTGVAGFQRQVVLKRIHRRLSDNPRAVEMFLGEARLAAALSHPSIVQIYDVGQEEGAYFIVMERVTGASLRELAEQATRQGRMIPMELSVTIIAQTLEGLCYAHAFRDETGQPLRIVHRDISPTNILVSLDGAVKIVDFGIARAENQVRQDNGIAPGKFAYMAPEAILGGVVDARTDLFSVGVLLYELTVGQRLFRAASFEGMRRVVNNPIPPPTFARAGYPVDLEILVMRALERDPDDRFESAAEMLEDLEQFAFDIGLRISRLRLGRFVARTLGLPGASAGSRVESRAGAADAGPEVAQEDLDFDQGLFDGGRLESRRAGDGAATVQEAREAVAELVAGQDDDDEEGETVELHPDNQAQLRVDTVAPEEPEHPMEGSALVVTDDLVEEVADIEDEDAEILVEPPQGVTVPLARVRPRSDQEVTKKRRPGEVARAAFDSATDTSDLRRALADISKDLEAAAASDGDRKQRLHRVVEQSSAGAGRRQGSEDLVGELVGHPIREVSPDMTGAKTEREAARDGGGVVDELERVDHPGERPLDDLELSDVRVEASEPEPEEAPTALIVEPEDDDSSILEPAGPPEQESCAADDGLDDSTIEIAADGPEVVSVEAETEEGLDDPTVPETARPKVHRGGKKRRRRRKKRK